MRLPKPVYERIPQFYFLVGLLFMANGLYLGFEFVLAFYYIGFGLICCCSGVAIFFTRMQHRQLQPALQAAGPEADTPAQVEESSAGSSHELPAQH